MMQEIDLIREGLQTEFDSVKQILSQLPTSPFDVNWNPQSAEMVERVTEARDKLKGMLHALDIIEEYIEELTAVPSLEELQSPDTDAGIGPMW